MYICSICIAEKEIRLCKNIAKFLKICLFQLAKFCIFAAKFEIFFFAKKKNRGDRFVHFGYSLLQQSFYTFLLTRMLAATSIILIVVTAGTTLVQGKTTSQHAVQSQKNRRGAKNDDVS